jgi:hypothetical protein
VTGVDEIMPLLLQACPTFRDRWELFLADWGEEEPEKYTSAGEFALYIMDLYDTGNEEELSAAFEAIESLMRDGDAEVKNIAAVGILEDLQNLGSHREHGYVVFESWLGRQSEEAWRDLERVWDGKSSLAQVVRAELGMKSSPPWWMFWRRWSRAESVPDPRDIENPTLRRLTEQLLRHERGAGRGDRRRGG